MRCAHVLTLSLALLSASAARADDLPDEAALCTVPRRCSATGLDCEEGDRACVDAALARGLEVTCERPTRGARRFVYCPPGASSRDSRVVWVLLAVAFAVAGFGGAAIWLAVRRSPPPRA